MNPNQPVDEDELESALRNLRPASSQLDVSAVFYQAGYQAASQRPDPIGKRVSQWVIAAIVAAVIVAPVSYRAGVSTAQIADERSVPEPSLIAVERNQQNVDSVLITNKGTAPKPDSSQSSPGLFELVAEQWFPGNRVDQLKQGVMLTASYATTLSHDDMDQHLPDVGAVNRYKTFATTGVELDESHTLAVSDVMNIAESLGDF